MCEKLASIPTKMSNCMCSANQAHQAGCLHSRPDLRHQRRPASFESSHVANNGLGSTVVISVFAILQVISRATRPAAAVAAARKLTMKKQAYDGGGGAGGDCAGAKATQ